MIAEYIAVIAGSYLLGSIPSGLVLGKLKGVDVRQYGSGKTGTTNVLRTVGKKYAVIALVADVLKGVIAVLIGGYVIGSPAGEMAAGLAAIAGHNWSVFIKFQGGRGVATSVGGVLPMEPLAAAAGIGVFVLVIALTRYVSLGSMMGTLGAVALVATLVAVDRVPVEYVIYVSVAFALIVIQHKANLTRLLSGTENRLGQKAKKLETG
jgi:glycerol-3-phosphate acyltransferase PlsY